MARALTLPIHRTRPRRIVQVCAKCSMTCDDGSMRNVLIAIIMLLACDQSPAGECSDVVYCKASRNIKYEPQPYQDGHEAALDGPWPVELDEEWCPLGHEDVSGECAAWWSGVQDGTRRRAKCTWEDQESDTWSATW